MPSQAYGRVALGSRDVVMAEKQARHAAQPGRHGRRARLGRYQLISRRITRASAHSHWSKHAAQWTIQLSDWPVAPLRYTYQNAMEELVLVVSISVMRMGRGLKLTWTLPRSKIFVVLTRQQRC